MVTARRTAPAAPPVFEGPSFGDLTFYSGGMVLPEGRYSIRFDVRMHAFTKQDGSKGVERLGIMTFCAPLDGGETHEQFYSMGSKAHLSFQPNPDMMGEDGYCKALAPVPGGPAASAPRDTNWNLFLQSLYDAGLPQGIFTNDISVLDAIWVVTKNEPEPEGRKKFGAAVGEVAAQQQDRGPQLIPVVVEILDDGKPWEGGGGDVEATPAAAPVKAGPPKKAVPPTRAAAPAANPPVKTGPPARKAAPVVEPEPALEPAGDEDGDVNLQWAEAAASTVFAKMPKGTTKLLLRTNAFTALQALGADDDTAQAVLDAHFNAKDDAGINAAIGTAGYVVKGVNVVPAS